MEIFWNTIAAYNAQTWIIQCLLVIAGIFITTLQIFKPSRLSAILIKTYMISLYLWIAFAYYFYYCEPRKYHLVMTAFWVVLAAVWIWELIKGYTIFEPVGRYRIFAFLLMELPFVYPLISILRGLEFPAIVSPLMPNSIVTFTIGLLLLYSKRVNIFLVLLLCHWSLIGLTKTFFFNITEDYMLVAATIPAIYIFFRQYIRRHSTLSPKPTNKQMISILLTIFALMTGVLSLQYILTH